MKDTTVKLYTAIRSFLAASADGETFTPEDIATAIGSDPLTVHGALVALRERDLVSSTVIFKRTYWHESRAFKARHTVPLFAGTPEWIVESADGNLICWAKSELYARMIAAAMCRS